MRIKAQRKMLNYAESDGTPKAVLDYLQTGLDYLLRLRIAKDVRGFKRDQVSRPGRLSPQNVRTRRVTVSWGVDNIPYGSFDTDAVSATLLMAVLTEAGYKTTCEEL